MKNSTGMSSVNSLNLFKKKKHTKHHNLKMKTLKEVNSDDSNQIEVGLGMHGEAGRRKKSIQKSFI